MSDVRCSKWARCGIQFPVSCQCPIVIRASRYVSGQTPTELSNQNLAERGMRVKVIRIRYLSIMRGKVWKRMWIEREFRILWLGAAGEKCGEWPVRGEWRVQSLRSSHRIRVTSYLLLLTEIERSVAARYISNMQLSQCCHEGQWEREREIISDIPRIVPCPWDCLTMQWPASSSCSVLQWRSWEQAIVKSSTIEIFQ